MLRREKPPMVRKLMAEKNRLDAKIGQLRHQMSEVRDTSQQERIDRRLEAVARAREALLAKLEAAERGEIESQKTEGTVSLVDQLHEARATAIPRDAERIDREMARSLDAELRKYLQAA